MVIWYEPLLLADIVHIRSFFAELISHIKCIFYCFLELASSNQSNGSFQWEVFYFYHQCMKFADYKEFTFHQYLRAESRRQSDNSQIYICFGKTQAALLFTFKYSSKSKAVQSAVVLQKYCMQIKHVSSYMTYKVCVSSRKQKRISDRLQ